jgi:hypothetical protein
MTMTTYTVSCADAAPLTKADRCDRCAAQAYVRAALRTGAELLFCGHHINEHRAAPLASGASLHDESAKLAIAWAPELNA